MKIAGLNINNVRYADGRSDSKHWRKIAKIRNEVSRSIGRRDLKIIFKTIVVIKNNVMQYQNKQLGKYSHNRWLLYHRNQEEDRNSKTGFHKTNHNNQQKVLKTQVWTTLTYGCETQTFNKKERDKMEAFEM